MKKIAYIIILLPLFFYAQEERKKDSTEYDYYYIEGDSIPYTAINLNEVVLLHKLDFDSAEDRRTYLILRRKTIKVYPYAKLAAERLKSLNERIASMERRRDKKRYTKIMQKYIEDEFKPKLKKFTRTEGQILIKLIHRQTGATAFELIRELRNGWNAFWFNNTASMFDMSLKKGFDPMHVKEDYLIEDVLQRNFQSGRLERQEPAIDIDFLELTDKWLNNSKTADSETTN